jgi:hypothetical protein
VQSAARASSHSILQPSQPLHGGHVVFTFKPGYQFLEPALHRFNLSAHGHADESEHTAGKHGTSDRPYLAGGHKNPETLMDVRMPWSPPQSKPKDEKAIGRCADEH